MIKLIFTLNREVFRVEIEDKEVWYGDRRWNKMIRLIPKDKAFIKKIIMSRNKIPNTLINLFELTDKEKEEYNKAKNDKELAEICIKDCKSKGAILLKEDDNP